MTAATAIALTMRMRVYQLACDASPLPYRDRFRREIKREPVATLIEDYGLIGDGETAALVHRNGSIDWLCWPRFDSDACFAALLGTREHGRWKLSPVDPVRVERRYQPDTLVLETQFETEHGAVRLTDFMPIRDGASVLVRMLQGVRERVRIRSDLNLQFDFGSIRPWIEIEEKRAVGRVGPDLVALYSPAPLRHANGSVLAELELGEGEEMAFTLAYGSSVQPWPQPIDPRGRWWEPRSIGASGSINSRERRTGRRLSDAPSSR
jgi:hypothetical protein